jgi:hypothetical protein
VPLLCLLGNDLAFDLVVGSLRNDFLSDQLVLPFVRTILDYLFRIGIADPGKGFQFISRWGVDVE